MPRHGRYVWVPGHFEKVLVVRDCRKIHRPVRLEERPGRRVRTRGDHREHAGRHGRAARHAHYEEVWVPGAWVRV